MPLADLFGSEKIPPTTAERVLPYLGTVWIMISCVIAGYLVIRGWPEEYVVFFLMIMGCVTFVLWTTYEHERVYRSVSKWKVRRKVVNVEDTVILISDFDRDWNLDLMEELARDTFMEVNKAWVGKNWEMLKDHLSYEILDELGTLILTMERLGQSHVLEDLTITDLRLVKLEDHLDDHKDSFTALIEFDVVEYTTNRNGFWTEPDWTTHIEPNRKKDMRSHREFWTFQFHCGGCRVTRIRGAEAEKSVVEDPIVLRDWRYMEILREIEEHKKRMMNRLISEE